MPPSIIKDAGLGVGQHLALIATADGKIVLTPKRKFI
jgi:antitoxin ChpS